MRKICRSQGFTHCSIGSITVRKRCCHMICIPWHSISDNLTVYFRSTFYRMVHFLKNNDSWTFCHNKTIAWLIPWSWCFFRRVISSCRKRSGCRESRNTCTTNCRFCSSGNHYICGTNLNNSRSITNSMSSCRTSCNDRMVWSF